MLWGGEGLTNQCTIIDTQLQVTVKARRPPVQDNEFDCFDVET